MLHYLEFKLIFSTSIPGLQGSLFSIKPYKFNPARPNLAFYIFQIYISQMEAKNYLPLVSHSGKRMLSLLKLLDLTSCLRSLVVVKDAYYGGKRMNFRMRLI